MRMPVQQNIPLPQLRQIVRIPDMSVRCEDLHGALGNQRIIRKHRKIQHHLIDLRLAVAAHTENAVSQRIQQRNHRFRRIFLRQIVARPVIEQIPEQQQTVCLLRGKAFCQQSAKMRRAVNIRCDHPFHSADAPFVILTGSRMTVFSLSGAVFLGSER